MLQYLYVPILAERTIPDLMRFQNKENSIHFGFANPIKFILLFAVPEII
jgi:hypothetical protein